MEYGAGTAARAAWGDKPDYHTRNAHGAHLLQLTENLLALHYDFELGDEIMISRHGAVKGKQFVINKASYKVVILPELDSLLESLQLLAFLQLSKIWPGLPHGSFVFWKREERRFSKLVRSGKCTVFIGWTPIGRPPGGWASL